MAACTLQTARTAGHNCPHSLRVSLHSHAYQRRLGVVTCTRYLCVHSTALVQGCSTIQVSVVAGQTDRDCCLSWLDRFHAGILLSGIHDHPFHAKEQLGIWQVLDAASLGWRPEGRDKGLQQSALNTQTSTLSSCCMRDCYTWEV